MQVLKIGICFFGLNALFTSPLMKESSIVMGKSE
nr:MAG TPA: hypothetical protein [Caudoviricetes sp.]